MAVDALDPGPNGDYPYLDLDKQPQGIRTHPTARDAMGNPVRMDVALRLPDGTSVHDIER